MSQSFSAGLKWTGSGAERRSARTAEAAVPTWAVGGAGFFAQLNPTTEMISLPSKVS